MKSFTEDCFFVVAGVAINALQVSFVDFRQADGVVQVHIGGNCVSAEGADADKLRDLFMPAPVPAAEAPDRAGASAYPTSESE